MSALRRPWQAVDYDELVRSYPPPPDYFESAWFDPPEVIDRRKLVRLQQRLLAAERTPFYARRWKEAGFDPRSFRSLDQLGQIPSYTIDDIRESIAMSPPYGDYQGVGVGEALSEPMRLFTSGGTTGKPRPTLYTAWDREVHAILTARAHYAQGVRPGDVVINSWLYGTHNAAWAVDDALYRWLNCVVIPTSSGTVTSTEKQVEYAIDYGATAVCGTGEYLIRFAEVARSMGYDPQADLKIKALPNIGDPRAIEAMFAMNCMQQYGFHEVGWIAIECPARQGLHIFEDAVTIEIVDPETGAPLPDGELGAICLTEFYKTGSAQIRFNSLDLSMLYPREQCECGSWLRRMAPFAGRADNMVKLRGINVWPEAIGEIAASVPGASTEYFVRRVLVDGREELVASVECAPSRLHDRDALQTEIERKLKDRIGVRIIVEVVDPGALLEWTGVATHAKPVRYRDDRDAGPGLRE